MPSINAPDLFQRKRNRKLKEHDEYIRQNKGICPAILAANLDVTERFVIIRQRKLGPVDKRDSQITFSMIQDCLSRGGRIGARRSEQCRMGNNFTAVAA